LWKKNVISDKCNEKKQIKYNYAFPVTDQDT
jgi:hypothetical protein